MNRMRIAAFFAAIVIAFSSCTITEELALNSDYSGNYKMELDFSQMAGLGAFDGGGGATMDSSMEASLSKFESIEGISNVKNISDTIKHTYGVSYDFKDIDALNRCMKEEDPNKFMSKGGSTGDKDVSRYEVKGKTLTRFLPKMDKQTLEEEDAKQMLTMSRYKFKVTHNKGIKKIYDDGFKKKGAKGAELDVDFEELIKKYGDGAEMKFKFK